LMQGAAGVGIFLVHLDEACRHTKPLDAFSLGRRLTMPCPLGGLL
jgi:hypothetical protein